jgi:hypothetical protein
MLQLREGLNVSATCSTRLNLGTVRGGGGWSLPHPGVEFRANLKSISHRCHLFEVTIVWELTQETIYLPMGCLQGGGNSFSVDVGGSARSGSG